jgi:predicted alpha/beta superfamily hydrolase
VPVSGLTLRTHERFHSQFLPDDRDVTVYLPPGYDTEPRRHYPVLYLHDGQNLFDPDTAFTRGEHWRVGETATALINDGRIEPLIIVGISNTGKRRLSEYTPTADKRRGGAEADAYGRLLCDELKPFIDGAYRTLQDPHYTGIGGSSLGGLVSLYLGLVRPDVFSRVAALSPSVWWDRRAILRYVRDANPKPRLRVWLDIGTAEGRQHVTNLRLLRAGMLKAGWTEGDDLHYAEIDGGTHSERAWADRFDRVLEYLYGPQSV